MWHSCDDSAWDPISVAAWLRYRSGSHLPAWVELPRAAALLLLFWAVSHGPMHWIWWLNRKPPTCLPQGHFSDALAHLGWDIWIPEVPVQWWRGEDQLAGDGREEAAARSCVNHPLYQRHILCQDFFVLHAYVSSAPSHLYELLLCWELLCPLALAIHWDHFDPSHQTPAKLRHGFNHQKLGLVSPLPTSSSNGHRHLKWHTQHYKPS